MELFDNLLGTLDIVPRYGGELHDRRIPVERIEAAVGGFLPRDTVTGKGFVRGMVGFGWTPLCVHATVEDSAVATLGVQLTADASQEQRTAGVSALMALGELGLMLVNDRGEEIDLGDVIALRTALGVR